MTPAHAVVGASGNVGRATALALRARGAPTRVVLRPARDDSPWRNWGIESAVADLGNAGALAGAFEGAASAFVLNPPAYCVPDLFERAALFARSIREAARAARLPRLVVLSSMGAQRGDGPAAAVALARPSWAGVLAGWGFTPVTVQAWSEMFDGFNSGRIAFEREGTVGHGHVTLDAAVSDWVMRAGGVDTAPAEGPAARVTA